MVKSQEYKVLPLKDVTMLLIILCIIYIALPESECHFLKTITSYSWPSLLISRCFGQKHTSLFIVLLRFFLNKWQFLKNDTCIYFLYEPNELKETSLKIYAFYWITIYLYGSWRVAHSDLLKNRDFHRYLLVKNNFDLFFTIFSSKFVIYVNSNFYLKIGRENSLTSSHYVLQSDWKIT